MNDAQWTAAGFCVFVILASVLIGLFVGNKKR